MAIPFTSLSVEKRRKTRAIDFTGNINSSPFAESGKEITAYDRFGAMGIGWDPWSGYDERNSKPSVVESCFAFA